MAKKKYQWKAEDSIPSVAQMYGLSPNQLLQANPGTYKFSTGQVINLPRLKFGDTPIPPDMAERVRTGNVPLVDPRYRPPRPIVGPQYTSGTPTIDLRALPTYRAPTTENNPFLNPNFTPTRPGDTLANVLAGNVPQQTPTTLNSVVSPVSPATPTSSEEEGGNWYLNNPRVPRRIQSQLQRQENAQNRRRGAWRQRSTGRGGGFNTPPPTIAEIAPVAQPPSLVSYEYDWHVSTG